MKGVNIIKEQAKIKYEDVLKRGVNKYMDSIMDTYESLDKDSKQIIDTLLKRHYTN